MIVEATTATTPPTAFQKGLLSLAMYVKPTGNVMDKAPVSALSRVSSRSPPWPSPQKITTRVTIALASPRSPHLVGWSTFLRGLPPSTPSTYLPRSFWSRSVRMRTRCDESVVKRCPDEMSRIARAIGGHPNAALQRRPREGKCLRPKPAKIRRFIGNSSRIHRHAFSCGGACLEERLGSGAFSNPQLLMARMARTRSAVASEERRTV